MVLLIGLMKEMEFCGIIYHKIMGKDENLKNAIAKQCEWVKAVPRTT
jgi:hypothetical protein